ncbi:MAG: NADH-quinone oxidoreductase subunit L [Desulfobacteraceae bacterium]|nr:NADH-quinone oxidoreductase subunit L [Desulfobacteraceae bacterium]
MELLWLIPASPLAGFLVLTLAGSKLTRGVVSAVGIGSVGISAAAAVWVMIAFLRQKSAWNIFSQTLWTWLDVAQLKIAVAFYLDPLALVMVLIITGVGFLIHLYSAGYMARDEGYCRFFAYMNLFVSAMLILVLADNLLLLYLGWEGVGLCSYLLIGFWYQDPANGYAARKAFVVTRVGDTAMAVGFFMIYQHLDTLRISEIMSKAAAAWPVGSSLPLIIALLLLGGGVGKSAQLPLQTWLPDAMAGPTPVSALIHAATMVTAGVYLIARTHVLFNLAPLAMNLVAVIGAATLLLAGFSGLVQKDIKRVLAYSTISQLGYMFLALGVGAWSAAIFHLATHAFFKALLFLSAGAVIHSLGGEQNMFKMGGLWREMPLIFWTFLIGAASLAALPLVTAGFYSKDLIIWQSFASVHGGAGFYAAALAGALLTALYTFRMVFLTFAGPVRTPVTHRPGISMTLPLVILAALSLFAGFLEMPETLGGVHLFSRFISGSLPEIPIKEGLEHLEGIFEIVSGVVTLFGIYFIYLFLQRMPGLSPKLSTSAVGTFLNRFWLQGWGFDWLYDGVFVRPYVFFGRMNREDVIDSVYDMIAWFGRTGYSALSLTQNGQVRTYAFGIALGVAAIMAMAVLL